MGEVPVIKKGGTAGPLLRMCCTLTVRTSGAHPEVLLGAMCASLTPVKPEKITLKFFKIVYIAFLSAIPFTHRDFL